MKAKVAERGQVTIPKALRDKLGIRPGTVLEFETQEGYLIARKQQALDSVRSAIGCLKHLHISTDQFIKRLRGEV